MDAAFEIEFYTVTSGRLSFTAQGGNKIYVGLSAPDDGPGPAPNCGQELDIHTAKHVIRVLQFLVGIAEEPQVDEPMTKEEEEEFDAV